MIGGRVGACIALKPNTEQWLEEALDHSGERGGPDHEVSQRPAAKLTPQLFDAHRPTT